MSVFKTKPTLNGEGSSPEDIKEITYAELVSLRDTNQLIQGKNYRITDYATTTSDPESRSCNYQYDIIVTALSSNSLSENASAINHKGDTHFSNSKLNAWRLWYCLDNDTSRFNWADTVKGKGVVYRMIDEWNNDLWYDFKNIQFKRYKITAVKNTVNSGMVGKYLGFKWVNSAYPKNWTEDTNDFIWMFTFHNSSLVGETEGAELSTDVTIGTHFANNNIIGQYLHDTPKYRGVQGLYNIVFCAKFVNDNHFLHGNHSNTIYAKDDLDIGINRFNSLFRHNIIYSNVNHNSFGSCFQCNTIGSECVVGGFNWNTFLESHFANNCIGDEFGTNTVDHGCESNVIGNLCKWNFFGDSCLGNTIGNNCQDNDFRGSFQRNTVGDGFSRNQIGVICLNNVFGNNVVRNVLEPNVTNNTFKGYSRFNYVSSQSGYNTFGTYANNIKTSGPIQCVKFADGTSSSYVSCIAVKGFFIGGTSDADAILIDLSSINLNNSKNQLSLVMDSNNKILLSYEELDNGKLVTKGYYKNGLADTEWHSFSA